MKSLPVYLELGLEIPFLVAMIVLVVGMARMFRGEVAQYGVSRRAQPGDDKRLEVIWSHLGPLLVPGHPIPTVALRDGLVSSAIWRPGRPPRLVFRRALLAQLVEVLRGEIAHEYAHTFKSKKMTAGLAGALVVLLASELGAVALTWSSVNPLANPLVTCFFATVAGWYALAARLSRREELRADHHAANLLGSARPVIAMLEQMREDCRAHGSDPDQWRLSDRLLATHPPVEVRIQALSHSRLAESACGSPQTGAAGC